MRHSLIAPLVLLGTAVSAPAQVSIGVGIGLPGVNIGINFPMFPDLVRVPGYPVYYAPGADANYFFYDGMYWVYQGDDWYASSWYNGPWGRVAPEAVPLFILRIPVSYYRRPPAFFGSWQRDAPPHWGEHWGRGWEERRRGWNTWDRRSAPAPARLPTYQRNYAGERYPGVQQQRELRERNYRYQPREGIVREHYREQRAQPAAPSPDRGPQRGQSPRDSRPADPQPQRPRPEEPARPRPTPQSPPQSQPQPGGREAPRPQPPQGREREAPGRTGPGEARPSPGRDQGRDQGRGPERPRENRGEKPREDR
ncbi:hypothetical protein [Geothrix sp. 21YS21S-4]|uniref:hypothetical protein n=1 Tax=Geothrix sp. 21YS21S-4 TaxID=3068889 RepID=UPI0027BAE641|nr:hypothetical protein [Geothrix sp. 21YS21S-4]